MYKDKVLNQATVYAENSMKTLYFTPKFSERYFSNYVQYHQVPSKEDLQLDMEVMRTLQSNNENHFIHFQFDEGMQIPEEIYAYLKANNFEFSEYVFMEHDNKDFPFSRLRQPIQIKKVDGKNMLDYLAHERKFHEVYGQNFARQMIDVTHEFFMMPKSHILIAVDDFNNIVGSLNVLEHDDYVEFDEFQVDEEYRRQGIGSALQEAGIKIANGKKVILVADNKSAAKEMYLKQGYQVKGSYQAALYVQPEGFENI